MADSGVYLMDADAFLDFIEAMTEFYSSGDVDDNQGD